MNGGIKFEGKTLDAKISAEAIGRVFSGAMDYQWCADNGQLTVRGTWNREADLLIKSPSALWKKMCKGYQPREGRDYEFAPVGTLPKNADVGFGDDDDSDDIDDSDIEGDDESAADDNPFAWLIEAGELPEGTRPSEPDKGFWQPDGTWAANESLSVPAGDVTDSAANSQSWRAEVVSDALEEDADSSLWALARHESGVAARRNAGAATLVLLSRGHDKARRRYMRSEGMLYWSDGRCFTLAEGVQG